MVNDGCGVEDTAIADYDRNQTNRIELDGAFLFCRTKNPGGETDADQTDGNVNEEDPTPVVCIREQTTEYRADSGSSYHDHAINAEGPSLFLVFECREKHDGTQR